MSKDLENAVEDIVEWWEENGNLDDPTNNGECPGCGCHMFETHEDCIFANLSIVYSEHKEINRS